MIGTHTFTTYICYDADMQRTTIFLPDELHGRLRREAFETRTTMAEIIRRRIEAGSQPKPSTARASEDPLLAVAGICAGESLSQNIDEALYGDAPAPFKKTTRKTR